MLDFLKRTPESPPPPQNTDELSNKSEFDLGLGYLTPENSGYFKDLGAKSAEAAEGQIAGLHGSLQGAYSQFLTKSRLDDTSRKKYIEHLKQKALDFQASINKQNAEIQNAKDEVRRHQEQIKELKERRKEADEVRRSGEGGGNNNLFPFIIGSIITLFLTFYLFIFYSSTAYSVFYGVEPGTLSFINSDVFGKAQNLGNGVFFLIIFFTFIPLGLGFLIHDGLETKTYGKMSILIFIVLILDAIMGYMISKNLHINQFNQGLTNEMWHWSMFLTDMTFWLVLLLGFVVYVIWGILLNYSIRKWAEVQDVYYQSRELGEEMEAKEKDMRSAESRINNHQAIKKTDEMKLGEARKRVTQLEAGQDPLDEVALQGAISAFMNGWTAWINLMKGTDSNRQELIDQAHNIQQKWSKELSSKTQSILS